MDDNQTIGRIFDIQRYSIHDGNGIRTIVFLKGCRLRCKWCCNPESQEYAVQTMKTADGEKVTGRDVTVGEVMAVVERDRGYYARSGGGMTLSGGECLCQPEFCLSLLREAKSRGITTAIESTACADWQIIERVLPYVDQYLLDIKHTDSAKHREFTSQPNELILENARKIAQSGQTELTVRVPVVPGFNATEREIGDIARFASQLSGVKGLHLLPYHRLGTDKYAWLGRGYSLSDVLPPDDGLMQKLLAAARQYPVKVQVGG